MVGDGLRLAPAEREEGDGVAEGLPLPLTSLIGRDDELALSRKMLGDREVRLLTMTGPPGVGKTRLALALAQKCEGDFGDGGVFVPLAPVTDARLVISTICRVVGVPEVPQVGLFEGLKLWLRDRELLLLLDNFEQVASAGPLLTELVVASRGLKLLVTSRIRVRVSAEREFPVSPLGLPAAGGALEPSAVVRSPAVALFCERARAVSPFFSLSDADAPAVAEICVGLDGLPLAIELAAARVKVLSPAALRERLDSRLELLTGGPRDAPGRQRTLRATIEWSYELLDADEQRLFQTIAVFAGGCTLEAVEALAAAIGDSSPVLDRVAALVDHNLLRRADAAGEQDRLTMLETIREYGLERLASSGGEASVRTAHADYYLGLAEAAEPALTSAESEDWLIRLEREHDNLRAALRLLLDAGTEELALRLAGALSRFWMQRGHLREGSRWCEQALAISDQPSPVQAKVLLGAALLAHDLVLFNESKALFKQAVELCRAAEDSHSGALALAGLAFVIAKEGDFAGADRMYEQALALAREADEHWLVAHVGERRGTVLWMAGDYARGAKSLEESLAVFERVGDRREIAFVSASLGIVGVAQGDLEEGGALIEQVLPTLREGSSPRYVAQAVLYAGEARLARGDLAAARAAYREVLERLRPLGFAYGIMMALSGLGRVATGDGRPAQAVRMFGAADAVAERMGGVTPAFTRRRHAQGLADARAALGEEAFEAGLAEGRDLTLDEAMDEAAMFAVDPVARGELTAREVEILRLVAQQLTNKEIAGRLFVSVRTVHAHLRSIFRKLGVGSRAAARRRAVELDLL